MLKKICFALATIIIFGMIIDLFDDRKERDSIYQVTVLKNRNDRAPFKSMSDLELVADLRTKDCVEFVECVSAIEVAEKYEKTEDWVDSHYKINIRKEMTLNDSDEIVSVMRCGSRAMIIDRHKEYFKVLNILDDSIGWVSENHISRTFYLNPKSYKKC
jgi:hypothetical protein